MSLGRDRLKVLINGLHAKSGGGVTYLRNVLPGLAGEADLDLHLVLHESQRSLFPDLPPTVVVHWVAFPDGFLRRLAWEQIALPGLARRLGVRVTFSPANFGPLLAPCPVILLRNALAVSATEARWSKKFYWAALAAMTWLSLLGCRRAIAVSDYARRMLIGRLPGRFGERIAVVPHGVGAPFAPPPSEGREDFILAVGDLYIQKNLHRLIAALARLRATRSGIRLRIAGAPVDADYADRLRRDIAAHGLEDNVVLLGPLPPTALAELYRRCAVFVFPSLVETFGNPLVEAMASGAAIVCANAAAMPEVVGDAALLFDPTDEAALAARLDEALADPELRRRLGARALARAGSFSWAETARRTAAVLRAAAA